MNETEITIQCCGLVAHVGDYRYAWGLGDWLYVTQKNLADSVLAGVIVGQQTCREIRETGWWIACVADCYDPPRYLIQADNFHEAMDIFENSDEGASQMAIPPEALKDYGDGSYSYNDSGVALDRDNMQITRVDRLVFFAGAQP